MFGMQEFFVVAAAKRATRQLAGGKKDKRAATKTINGGNERVRQKLI